MKLFYPGTIFLSEDMVALVQRNESYFLQNNYLVTRYDAITIDGNFSHGSLCCKRFEEAWSSMGCEQGSYFLERNPFAVGHKLNHPNLQHNANVLLYEFNFSRDMRSDLRPFVPCVHFTNRSEQTVIQGLVGVALKDLQDKEELFFDYRYDIGSAELPSWYIPIIGVPQQ